MCQLLRKYEITFALSLVVGLFFFLILFYFLTLQYCVGFAIYQHESAKEIKPVNLKENQP